MKHKSHYLFALSLLGIATSAHSRAWIDTNGRQMDAEYVRTAKSSKGTEVVFKKTDGMHDRFPLASLSEADQKLITEPEAAPELEVSGATAAEVPKTEFEQSITKNLVKSSGSRTQKVSQAELTSKEYYAIYYSAHWCPPCRGFTPKLVDFYNKASKQHDNFEIIFVSSDRSEKDMAAYMEEANMPWLALDFDTKKSSKDLTKFASNGIPSLVLVDSDGNVLSDSYENGKYLGPTKVMNDLEKRLKKSSNR
jgi:nucleoredoxin